MNLKKAREYMDDGGRVLLPTWEEGKFITIYNDVIVDQDKKEFKLKPEEEKSKEWLKHKDDRQCFDCSMIFDKNELRGARYERERKICENCYESNENDD